MQFAVDPFPVFVVAFLFRHQVATVGRGVQQNVVRRLFQRAIKDAFEHSVITLARLEREVVAKQHETLG
ncbi:hypothetical protein D3C81_2182880 [compost metagenome]